MKMHIHLKSSYLGNRGSTFVKLKYSEGIINVLADTTIIWHDMFKSGSEVAASKACISSVWNHASWGLSVMLHRAGRPIHCGQCRRAFTTSQNSCAMWRLQTFLNYITALSVLGLRYREESTNFRQTISDSTMPWRCKLLCREAELDEYGVESETSISVADLWNQGQLLSGEDNLQSGLIARYRDALSQVCLSLLYDL